LSEKEQLEQEINKQFNRLEMLNQLAQETQEKLGQLIIARRARYKLTKKPKPKEKKNDE